MNQTDLILEMLKEIQHDIRETRAEVRAHIEEEEELLERHTAEIIALQAGFPNGDMHGHQLYHASIIERNQWVTSLLKDVSKEVAKLGLLGILAWLGYHLVEDLISRLK